MYGQDYGYAQTRIQGTIVRIKKDQSPVYVMTVGRGGVCTVIPIEHNWNSMEHSKEVHIDDLDMHPVPLGYVNCVGEATYLMRIPMRRDWKQGLRNENCFSSGRALNNIPMKNIKRCIMGEYPSYSRCIKDVKIGVARGRVKILAWNRSWAVSTDDVLYYKNLRPVGNIDNGVPKLLKEFEHLKESLEESLHE